MGNLLDKLDDLDNLDDLDTLDKASLVSGCDAIVPVSAHHLQADCGRSRSWHKVFCVMRQRFSSNEAGDDE
jgi:hypothetical protein